MSKYEIQVMRSDDDGPMTLIDRCVVTADSVPEAASRYAMMFNCSKEVYRVRYTNATDAIWAIDREWQASSSRDHGDVVQEVMLHCTADVRSELSRYTGIGYSPDPASAGRVTGQY